MQGLLMLNTILEKAEEMYRRNDYYIRHVADFASDTLDFASEIFNSLEM